MFFFAFLAVIKISRHYVSLNGSRKGECSKLSPCSYELVTEKIKPGDNVCFLDNEIKEKKDLIRFQTCVSKLLPQNIKVIGSNTIINGTQLKQGNEYFIFSREGCKSGFSNFTFTNFKSPVLNINGAMNSSFANLTFTNNYMTNGNSIVMFTVSEMLVYNLTFTENTVDNSCVFFMSTSRIIGSIFNFERNFAAHDSPDALIRMSNAIILADNVTIKENSAYDGPLIFGDGRTFVYGCNVSIINNAHTEICIIDGITNLTLFQSEIERNKGVLLETTMLCFLQLEQTKIINNFSPHDPLFYFPYGILSSNNDTVISGNFGKSFVQIDGINSSVILFDTLIEKNSFDDEMFFMPTDGAFNAYNSTFNVLHSNKAIVYSSASEISLDRCKITNIVCPFIVTNNRTVNLYENAFDGDIKSIIKGKDLKFTELNFSQVNETSENEAIKRGFAQLDLLDYAGEYETYFFIITFDDDIYVPPTQLNQTALDEKERERNINNDPIRYIEEYNLTK